MLHFFKKNIFYIQFSLVKKGFWWETCFCNSRRLVIELVSNQLIDCWDMCPKSIDSNLNSMWFWKAKYVYHQNRKVQMIFPSHVGHHAHHVLHFTKSQINFWYNKIKYYWENKFSFLTNRINQYCSNWIHFKINCKSCIIFKFVFDSSQKKVNISNIFSIFNFIMPISNQCFTFLIVKLYRISILIYTKS